MNYKYLLPIGSVVKTKDKANPIMIIQNDKDYIGVSFPIGFTNDKQVEHFKVKDVEKIYFIGYQNKELNIKLMHKNFDRIIEGGE